jgi:hypothetical protein
MPSGCAAPTLMAVAVTPLCRVLSFALPQPPPPPPTLPPPPQRARLGGPCAGYKHHPWLPSRPMAPGGRTHRGSGALSFAVGPCLAPARAIPTPRFRYPARRPSERVQPGVLGAVTPIPARDGAVPLHKVCACCVRVRARAGVSPVSECGGGPRVVAISVWGAWRYGGGGCRCADSFSLVRQAEQHPLVHCGTPCLGAELVRASSSVVLIHCATFPQLLAVAWEVTRPDVASMPCYVLCKCTGWVHCS